jgi:hypothetical protein
MLALVAVTAGQGGGSAQTGEDVHRDLLGHAARTAPVDLKWSSSRNGRTVIHTRHCAEAG